MGKRFLIGKRFLMAAMLASAPLLVTSAANANPNANPFDLQISEAGDTPVTVTGTTPFVMFAGSYGTFSVNVNAGTATISPSIDLLSGEVSTSTAGTLTITLSETGLLAPSGLTNWWTEFSGSYDVSGSSVALSSYVDSTDTMFGTGTALSTLSSSTQPFALQEVAAADISATPFAMTEILTIDSAGAGQFSLDGSLDAVPAPASLTLFGTALLGLGAFGLFRRRKQLV
jgi:hypothetical protein